MNPQQFEKVRSANGFIAALDQSGGSTPKALSLYGIEPQRYSGDQQMFDLMHQMRARIITSPAFDGRRILGGSSRADIPAKTKSPLELALARCSACGQARAHGDAYHC